MTFWKKLKLKYIQNRKEYRKYIKYIFILVTIVIIFIILNFYLSKKNIFEDIVIFNLWKDIGSQKEYELTPQNNIEIDVFTTINSINKKLAPGSKGSFVIRFKRPINSIYKIKINDKTIKPQNLVFWLENKKYLSLKEMQDAINKEFINREKITINWEWEYYIDDVHDIEDTKDAQNIQKYIFEIVTIIEN